MTIADKIERLQAAKAAIAAAITGKGGTVAAGDGFEDFAADVASIPSGITPSGNIDITTTSQVDVTNYATAQVVDADLVPGNIKKDVDVLGVVGTMDGEWFLPLTKSLSYAFNLGDSDYMSKPPYPSSVTIVAPYCVSINYTFGQYITHERYQNGIEEATLDIDRAKNGVQARSALHRNQTLRKLTFIGGVKLSSAYNAGIIGGDGSNRAIAIEEVHGEIDCSNCYAANPPASFLNAFCPLNDTLRIIEFKANTIPNTTSFGNQSHLTDDSILSIANGLNETHTGTLTLHATPKARCSTIMGTVALDETQTYHVFTADPSGTVSLADFVTNTKGWTLA